MEKVSMSHEDYLEAIAMLGGTTESSVRSVDIAEKLGVSKASVSKALTALSESGFVVRPHYGDVTFTQKGFDYAASVLDRHNMLTTFLVRAIGVDPEVAEEEACKMEHAISDDSFVLWKKFVEGLNL